MRKSSAITIAEYGCLLALAMMVSYIEALIPFHPGIPGAKLGLANCVIVLCLYWHGGMAAAVINIARVILCGLLFGNLYSMSYALTGALLSFFIMLMCKRFKVFSMIGVSALGGIAHNIGQLTIACIITKVPALFYYIPFLVLAGGITGFLNGSLAHLLYKRIPYFHKRNDINSK